jgi:DeoR family transcriptional regulator of aga operon/DeoR family fructose operon transcriptional repressor
MQIIKEERRASVKKLSELFNTSEVTIRADLKKLSENGLIKRTHGGAVYNGENNKKELPFEIRRMYKRQEKCEIGKAAANVIRDGEVVFIGGSTTAIEITPHLIDKRDLTVITNSLEIAHRMINTDVYLIIMGGALKRETLSLVGYSCEYILNEINISKAFFSAAAFSIEDGLTDINQEEIQIRKRIIKKTKKIIALVDSSKWNKTSLVTFLNTSELDTIITDSNAPMDVVESLINMGIEVISTPQ